MNDRKNPASVVHVPDVYSVVINSGSDQGVKQGDKYLIYYLGPELFDPDTDESLGYLEIVRGRAVVTHVQEKISTLETVEYEEIPGTRKIIKRDGGRGLLALSFGGQTEEIEEGPERNRRALNAEMGDFGKIIVSK